MASLISDFLIDGSPPAANVPKPDLREYFEALEIVSVKHPQFGAVGDNVVNDKGAIDAAHAYALANEKAVFYPKGNYKYVGEWSNVPDVMTFGEGMYKSLIRVTQSGFGANFSGTLGGMRDLGFVFSDQGLILSAAARNCNFNRLRRIYLQGPGRGANRAATDLHALRFDRQRTVGINTLTCYFNKLSEFYIKGFYTGVYWDAPDGSPALGGNNNDVSDFDMEEVWTGYHIRSIQSVIMRGAFNQSGGPTTTDYMLGVKVANGATDNVIWPPIGEPGPQARQYELDAGTARNVVVAVPANYSMGSIDASDGDNQILTNWGQQHTYSGLTENHYYSISFTAPFTTNNTAGFYTVRYASSSVSTQGLGGGKVDIRIGRDNAGTITAVAQNHIPAIAGNAVRFVGVEITSNVPQLVFLALNNGTASSAGQIVVTVEGAGQGASVSLDSAALDRGTSDPSDFKLLEGTATIDPVSIPAGTSVYLGDVTVTGLAANDKVTHVSHSDTSTTNWDKVSLTGRAKTNAIAVTGHNGHSGAIDLASGTMFAQGAKV
jgi:hypothetical protein